MVSTKITRSQLGLCYWLFCVFTVTGLVGLVAWLSLTPKNPNIRISNAHLPIQYSKNQSIPVPNNSIIFDLQVFNPNKRMGIYYGVINLELCGGDGTVVGTNSTPGFYQGYKNNTTLQIAVNAGREFWRGVSGGNVDFMVRAETEVKFRIIRWTTKAHRVIYEERSRKVKIGLNGTVLGDKANTHNATRVRIKDLRC